MCHSNDTHHRHSAGCKFTRNANTLKCFIIYPQLNKNLPTSVIQLAHKRAKIFFQSLKHSFLEINEIVQCKQVAIFRNKHTHSNQTIAQQNIIKACFIRMVNGFCGLTKRWVACRSSLTYSVSHSFSNMPSFSSTFIVLFCLLRGTFRCLRTGLDIPNCMKSEE